MALNFGLLNTELPAQIGALPGNALAARRQRIQQDEDRTMGREQAQMQNALARMQMTKAQGEMDEDAAFKATLSGAPAGDWNAVLPQLRQVAPRRALELEKQLGTMNKDRTETKVKMTDLAHKKLGMYREALIGVNTPQEFAQWLTAQHNDPDLQELMPSLPSLENSLATIPQDAREFEQMKVKSALGLGKFMEMNKPELQMQDFGGYKQMVQTNPMAGAVGPQGERFGKTLSPSDAVAQQGNQAMRDLLLQERQMRVDEGRAKADERSMKKQAVVAGAEQTLAVIDKALNHPGRSTATGLSGQIDPRNAIAGTDAMDFKTVVDQLQGKAFLEAFESLKGGGQITEMEGKKATDAMARLNRAQSDAEFVKSLNDLRDVVSAGIARMGGGQGAAPQAAPAKPGGVKFLGFE